MTDKRSKKLPWGWIILFVIVVIYFFASYMREHTTIQGSSATGIHWNVPSLEDALTPEAKKAASQDHTQGLSYGPGTDAPPLSIEDLPAVSPPPEDKQLKKPPTHTGAHAIISPIEGVSSQSKDHSLPGDPAIGSEPQVKSIPEGEEARKKKAQSLRDKGSSEREAEASWVALMGWTVQVAVFKEAESAQRLVKQLREKHLPAYEVQQFLVSDQAFIHVYVGPVLQHQQAEQLRYAVQQQVNLKGTVIPYESVMQAPTQVS